MILARFSRLRQRERRCVFYTCRFTEGHGWIPRDGATLLHLFLANARPSRDLRALGGQRKQTRIVDSVASLLIARKRPKAVASRYGEVWICFAKRQARESTIFRFDWSPSEVIYVGMHCGTPASNVVSSAIARLFGDNATSFLTPGFRIKLSCHEQSSHAKSSAGQRPKQARGIADC